MNKKRITIFCILLISLSVLFLAIYPFENTRLKLCFSFPQTEEGKDIYFFWGNGNELTSGVNAKICNGQLEFFIEDGICVAQLPYHMIITESEQLLLSDLIVYRNGIVVKSVKNSELQNYIYSTELITVENKTGVQINMTDDFSKMLHDLSTSRLAERCIMAVAILVLGLLIYGILIIFYNRIVEGSEQKSNIRRFVEDIRAYSYFAWYSAKADLKAEVANSYLNWVWWVLEPLCNMLVYYFVFDKIFGNSQQYFIIFIYSGLLMWNFFNRTITYSIKLVRSNREIVTKVYIPKFIILISNMILNGIKLLISLGILAVMMLIYRVSISYTLIYFLVAYVGLMLFTFGCGAIFLHLGVFIDDLGYAVSILLNMLFFLSGVFYDVEESIMAPFGSMLKILNPIAMYIDAMRNALLYNMEPNMVIFGVWFIFSVIISCIGVNIIYKYENSYVKVV